MFQYDTMTDERGYLTYEQCQALIDSAEDMRLKLLVKILFHSGRRISEVVSPLGPTPSDINFKDALITWKILKKNRRLSDKDKDGNVIIPFSEKQKASPKVASLPIFQDVLDDILVYMKAYGIREADYLFPFTRIRAFQMIKGLGEKTLEKYPSLFDSAYDGHNRKVIMVGSKPLHPHHFRHSFIVYLCKMAKSPADLRKIQILTQHSNIKMVENYLKYSFSEARSIINDAFASNHS